MSDDLPALVRPRALLLDLDGTLVDSAPDIAAALNLTLSALGRDTLPEARVRTMIGNGIGMLVRRALEATGGLPGIDELADVHDEMMRHYGAGLVVHTHLLSGAAELLATCAALGVVTACVTNKPGAMARMILRDLGVLDQFALVIGGDGETARKPAPDGLLVALAALGVDRAEAWMVGDGVPDAAAARAAGVRMVGVRSDYGEVPLAPDAAAQWLDDLHELATILRKAAPAG